MSRERTEPRRKCRVKPVKMLDVPYFATKSDYMCSEDAFASVLNYYGIKTTPEELAAQGFENLERAPDFCPAGLRCTLVRKGAIGLGDLFGELSAGRPVMIRVRPIGQEDWHSVVLVGYSRDRGIFYVHDNGMGRPYTEVPITEVLQRWDDADRTTVLVRRVE